MPAVIAAAFEVPYTRHPPAGADTSAFLADAVSGLLDETGLRPDQVDGLAVSAFSLAPDHAIDLAWRLGLSLRWIMQDTNGGASGINMLAHARRAVQVGDAQAVILLAGDAQGPEAIAQRQAAFNRATAEHLTPIGYGGPNSLFAMLTQRQMAAFGLGRSDYGQVAIAQRAWAGANPGAVYREPLTLDEYLSAPLVADPLGRFDCVPGVAGADAVLVTSDVVAASLPTRPLWIRAVAMSFNDDDQAGDGLSTGHRALASQLWEQAGCGPDDVRLACVYDDYPAIVLAQLDDLGFVPGHDLRRFVAEVIAPRRWPINTSGGLLSAGQAGAGGGLHGLVEAVRQLQGLAAPRQQTARLALVTGYGMVLYRYGSAAGAAVLERRDG